MTTSFDGLGRGASPSGRRRCGGAVALAVALLPVMAYAVHPAGGGPAEGVAEPAPSNPEHYFTTGALLEMPDSSRGVDHGAGVAYAYAGRLGERRSWELRVFADTLETGIAGATDYYRAGAGLDLVQYFGASTAGGHPYGLVGLGGVGNDVVPDADDGFSAYANFGIGWRSAPWRNWGVRHRIELRGVYDTFDSGQVDVQLGVALEIPPMLEKVVPRLVEKPVEVVRVVEKDVVREVPVAPPPPPDRDGDGVPDGRDKCPDTVAGAVVDADGCVRKAQVVVLPSIEFEYASHELTARGREQLDPVVRFMRDQPEIALDVWGHTDSQGEDDYNQRLSERRAASVVRLLVSQGIDAQRLASKGFGESRPIASNATIATRKKNRRVELNIRAQSRGGQS